MGCLNNRVGVIGLVFVSYFVCGKQRKVDNNVIV